MRVALTELAKNRTPETNESDPFRSKSMSTVYLLPNTGHCTVWVRSPAYSSIDRLPIEAI
jgi:hypothetical protein